MPFVSADWSIAANGNIRYIGDPHGDSSPSYATVIEFHRALQNFADDAAAAGNDLLDISSLTPSERSTDNIITLLNAYNIDQTAAEHLYDGSIIQSSGADIWDGIVNFGNASFIIMHQNGGVIANDFWNSFTPDGFNEDAGQGISHRFLVKTRTSGADVDGRRLRGLSREFGSTFSEFPINGTSRGNNVLALSQSTDLNNQTAAGTVSGWSDIVNLDEGYTGIDVTGDLVDEFYYSEWDRGSRTINQFYERMKWLTRRGTTSFIYGLEGELFRGITHQIAISGPSGTFVEGDEVRWPTGTGQLLAIDSPTAGTKMWIQLLTGVAPTAAQTITADNSGSGSATVGTVTERSVSTPFVGASTGSAIIGAYGIGIQNTDLTASDTLFDLDNTQRTPPNNVTFTVSGLVNGEDRVLVGPESGGALDTGQFLLNAGISGGAGTIVVKTGTEVPGTGTNSATDTPTTGTIRVLGNDGIYYRVTYTGYSVAAGTMTFTGCTGAPTAAVDNEVFISYIDKLADATTAAFTAVFAATRALFIRVRDGGGSPIKTFETTGSLGSAGGSATAIRTADA